MTSRVEENKTSIERLGRATDGLTAKLKEYRVNTMSEFTKVQGAFEHMHEVMDSRFSSQTAEINDKLNDKFTS